MSAKRLHRDLSRLTHPAKEHLYRLHLPLTSSHVVRHIGHLVDEWTSLHVVRMKADDVHRRHNIAIVMLQDALVRVQLETVVPNRAVWNITLRRLHIPKLVCVLRAQVSGSLPVEQGPEQQRLNAAADTHGFTKKTEASMPR